MDVKIISNVFFVPALKINLLSDDQLLVKGYVIILRNDIEEFSDPSKGIFAIVKMSQNRLFPLKIENVQSCSMADMKILHGCCILIWSLEHWWLEDPSKEECHDWNSRPQTRPASLTSKRS